MKLIILFLLFITNTNILAGEIEDVTGKANVRDALFSNTDNKGVRISWNGMKKMNAALGLGSVDELVAQYEKELSAKTDINIIKKTHPSVESVKVVKSDFKGYYITCTPTPSCVEAVSKNVPNANFTREHNGKKLNFTTSSTASDSYQHGYVKSRALANGNGFNEGDDLHKYLNEKMQRGIKKATGNLGIGSLKEAGPEFNKALVENIEKYRSIGIDAVDPKFKDIIETVDLMEVPFSSSTNITQALDDAIRPASNIDKNQAHIMSAQTGDDLFTIIQKDGEVKKIVGADARGLGVLNMTTRLDEYLKHSSNKGVNSVDDIFELSMNGIKSADDKMDKSLGTYDRFIKEEFKSPNGRTDDQIIKAAHERYLRELEVDPELMQMRAASITNCGTKQCIMDRITAIHNRQKVLEKVGIDTVFGSSCLGTEYILRKKGLK